MEVLEIQGLTPLLQGKYCRVYISGRKAIKQFYNWIFDNNSFYFKKKYKIRVRGFIYCLKKDTE
jgi:hypothetical protein